MRPTSIRSSLCRAGLLAALLCALPALAAPAADTVSQRLDQIREIGRFVPDRALDLLTNLEADARRAPVAQRAEFLAQLCQARRSVGQHKQALDVCDELIALGREQNNAVALAKGLIQKGYVAFSMDDLALSHQLVWEGERVAAPTGDTDLKIRAAITSGEAYAEEGNFPMGLSKLQAAVALARQDGKPVNLVMSLNALAKLYRLMREYDKGFATLDEAMPIARATHSPGRVATLYSSEYGLAMGAGQPRRAMKALLAALELEREIGATSMVAYTLVNLSDNYLRERDYPQALHYGAQVIDAARTLHDVGLEATARVNVGQAYMGMGRIAEGKRSFEQGLASYEKSDDKPNLQQVLVEYGAALERIGDVKGALAAYHRERALSDQLFERRRQKAILELQAKYEGDKKERQIELLRRENLVKSTELDNRRLQQRVWWLLAVVFALASAVVGLLYRKVRHANAQLQVKNIELKNQSVRDPLTGLYNRRHFQDFMRGYTPNERRGAGPSGDEMVGALFLLDVDHFKHINDTHGHAAGDAVLTMISDALGDILRETDMIVRWGGEEFLAFLPAVARSSLDDVARRVLTGIAERSVSYQGLTLTANVSIGFAPYPLAPDGVMLPWERAVNLVDMALYMAKSHGRNRAYGVNGFADGAYASMEAIEADLEHAWRGGLVDLSIVLAGWPELKTA